MEKIKMGLQDAYHIKRLENKYQLRLTDWREVEIIPEHEVPSEAREAYQQHLSKIQLEKDAQLLVKQAELNQIYDDVTRGMEKMYSDLESMKDYRMIYHLFNYVERLVEKAQKLDKENRNK